MSPEITIIRTPWIIISDGAVSPSHPVWSRPFEKKKTVLNLVCSRDGCVVYVDQFINIWRLMNMSALGGLLVYEEPYAYSILARVVGSRSSHVIPG